MSWLVIGLGAVLAVVGIAWSIAQANTGIQPWDPELADNVIFAKSLPLILGFGILTGVARALADRRVTERRPSDGAIRRFHPVTVFNHWINAVGFLLAMATGSVQYLNGVLDVAPPIPLFWVYRLHYLAASLIVFAAALFVTHRLMTGDRRLLPGPGQWIRSLRGLAHELPRPFGRVLATILGLDMKREPPPVGQFTFYEKTISFPIWTVLLALILVTGFLKTMKYVVPIPGDILWWASALHVAAMVLLAAKLLDHLRYVFAPSRWPLLRSMFTTWTGERYVQIRHPDWYRAIVAERALSAESTGEAALRPAGTPTVTAAPGPAE